MSDLIRIRQFSTLGLDDVPVVGGKNASLGEMVRSLYAQGVRVPDGFATTAAAWYEFLDANGLRERISAELARLDVTDVAALETGSARIRNWVRAARLPDPLAAGIRAGYAALAERYGRDPDVAVRSSATAEDLPGASFAGQQETRLNVRGAEALLATCLDIYASLFTARAISYREEKGFEHMKVALSLGVQKMVRSDRGASGVMFTLDTESGFHDAVLITASWGLGETVVQGTVNPDEFYVFKPTLSAGARPILRRRLGEKAVKMVYARGAGDGATTRVTRVSTRDRHRFCLNDDEVLELARYGAAIERHYSERAGRWTPMDIEWGRDGLDGSLYVLQARPETVHAAAAAAMETFVLEHRGRVLASGRSVGTRIASGVARVIADATHMQELRAGEVLVTDSTDPDWEPVMKRAAAIVADRGGRTCHAAIVARELGIPAVVGTGDGSARIATGSAVTVSCAEGDSGYVYEGALPFRVERREPGAGPRTRTKVMMNVGDPARAFELSRLPCDGVGLARLEFIITSSIGVHPRALIEFDAQRPAVKRRIHRAMAGYSSPTEFYVARLAEGMGTIAAAFHPRPVIVRLSDFKSNEYGALLGGAGYEPVEANPMLGFRGAARYPSRAFADCFALECAAVRRVRGAMGLTNLAVMIPFVRTVAEERRVLELMAREGLVRGEDGLRVYLMCEIPANALLAERFLEHCDGFSIGSNDLTQLTLGVDRDSTMVEGTDERDDAVKALMELAIAACRRLGKYCGICGQAPSDYPEITRWLVERGIESISLNPDSVLAMSELVARVEAEHTMAAAT